MRGGFVQDGAGGGFCFWRAWEQVQAGDGFCFETRHSRGDAFEAGVAVEGADGLEGWAAVEYGDRL
jgi:hypothetical protein